MAIEPGLLLITGVMCPTTGIIFNNQMKDFERRVKSPVAGSYGLTPSSANGIGAGKVPLSSMSPTIITDAYSGDVRLILGASGGKNIISSIAFVISLILINHNYGLKTIPTSYRGTRICIQRAAYRTNFSRNSCLIRIMSINFMHEIPVLVVIKLKV